MYLFLRKQGGKERVRKWSQEALKSSLFMSVYLCLEKRKKRESEIIVTSLVSLTEAGLIKPLGGSLTCV